MSEEHMSAGWYYAQGDPPGTTRYWDGSQWIGEPQTSTPGVPSSAEVDPTQRLTEAGPRLGARLLDGLIWALIGFVVNIPFIIDSIGESIDAANEGRDPVIDVDPARMIGVGLLTTLLIVGYEVLLNTRSRGTVGKRVVSVRIVQEDGSDLDTRSAMMRMVPYIVIQLLGIGLDLLVNPQDITTDILLGLPFLAVALAGLVMLFTDAKRQTPWDKVGKTLVVRD